MELSWGEGESGRTAVHRLLRMQCQGVEKGRGSTALTKCGSEGISLCADAMQTLLPSVALGLGYSFFSFPPKMVRGPQ